MYEPERQRILDEEHLRLLRVGYFIQGGATLVMCLFGLLYVFLGLFAFRSFPSAPGTPPPPVAMGYIFAWLGGLFTLAGASFATLQFLAARALRLRRSRALCMVTAGLSCVFVPYGTALGVFTFMVLGRPGVRALFDHSPVPLAGSVAQAGPPAPPVA
jgi:hypothetical protein